MRSISATNKRHKQKMRHPSAGEVKRREAKARRKRKTKARHRHRS